MPCSKVSVWDRVPMSAPTCRHGSTHSLLVPCCHAPTPSASGSRKLRPPLPNQQAPRAAWEGRAASPSPPQTASSDAATQDIRPGACQPSFALDDAHADEGLYGNQDHVFYDQLCQQQGEPEGTPGWQPACGRTGHPLRGLCCRRGTPSGKPSPVSSASRATAASEGQAADAAALPGRAAACWAAHREVAAEAGFQTPSHPVRTSLQA